jgi:hypothetical protein
VSTIPILGASVNARYTGVYQAVVVASANPPVPSAIQARIPTLPQFATNATGWAPPAVVHGTNGPLPTPPANGASCWIMFAGGLDTAPMWFPLI